MTRRFFVGEVVKLKGSDSICIVVGENANGTTDLVSLDLHNVSFCVREKTYTKEEYCCCNECEYCAEEKPRTVVYYGMEDAKFIASTVKEWISKTVMQDFGF